MSLKRTDSHLNTNSAKRYFGMATKCDAKGRRSQYDVYWAFSPMCYASRILGIFPVVTQKRKSGHGKIYERSTIAQIYGLLLILTGIIIVLTSYNDVTELISSLAAKERDYRKRLFVNKVEYIMSVIISTGNIIFVLTCISRLKGIFLGLSKVDSILSTTATSGNKLPKCRFYRKVATVQVVLVFIFGVAAGYTDFRSLGKGNPHFLWLGPYYFLRLITSCLEQQFLLLILLFRERFVLVNSRLENSVLCRGVAWSVVSKRSSDRIGHTRKQRVKPYKGGNIWNVNNFHSPAEMIEKLRVIHAVLSEEILTVNKAYELPIITDLIMLFFDFITGGYFLMSILLENNDVNVLASALSWVINSSVRIALLSWVAWDTVEKAKTAGPLIVKLMQRKSDTDLREELHIFIEQLSQNEVKFNLFGLFYLDMTLPQAMTQAATSYLLILLQFKTTD